MEGGTSLIFGRARIISFGKNIPLCWWVPQKERAVLAIACILFWASTISQALSRDASGASVLTFYGLGLLYTAAVMANAGGGARVSLNGYRRRRGTTEQSRALIQLYAIMSGVLVCNGAVLAIYIIRGASVTPLDVVCLAIAVPVLLALCVKYGWRNILRHPLARGYTAAACKAIPQLLLAGLFVFRPGSAHAFTLWALATLMALSMLRFWPSWLAFRRDRSSKHVQGLLLTESVNIVSIILLIGTWALAR